MKIVQVKAYEFDELDDAAKERARQWWREASIGDNYFSECTIDEAVEQGGLMGIDFDLRERKNWKGEPLPGEPKIWWSGFWSQGDGACFEGTWRARDVKTDKVAEGWGEGPATTEIKRIAAVFGELAKKYPFAYFIVKHRGHYSHEHCTEFDFDLDGVEGSESLISEKEWDEACEALKENAKDFMRWIYRQLEKEYEYQNSDEQVDENIRANEYLFTEEGKRTAIL